MVCEDGPLLCFGEIVEKLYEIAASGKPRFGFEYILKSFIKMVLNSLFEIVAKPLSQSVKSQIAEPKWVACLMIPK